MADTNRIFPSQFTQIGSLATNDVLLIADSSQTGNAEKNFIVSIGQILAFAKQNDVAFMGIATPTSPSSLTVTHQKEFYFAYTTGTYNLFKNSSGTALSLADGEIAILEYNGSYWQKDLIFSFADGVGNSTTKTLCENVIKTIINQSNVKSVSLAISTQSTKNLTLQSKVVHTNDGEKYDTVQIPSATRSCAGLESAADKTKLDSIEENATLGFNVIVNTQTKQEIIARKDAPLLLVIDNNLILCDFRPNENAIIVDPVGLAKISEAIGNLSMSATVNASNIQVSGTLQTIDGKTTKNISFTLPLATESLSGLLSPTDKKQIRVNKEDIVTEISDRKEADTELQKLVEENVLYFELNESTGEIVATTGGESVYKSITMSEDTGEIEVEQEV